MSDFHGFKAACSGISWIEPGSAEYPGARKIYQGESKAVPLAILQPQTREEVQQIIAASAQHGVKVTIRSGGHNIPGLCIQDNSVTIDMRHITAVEIAPDKQSAFVGGGATNLHVARALEAEGLITPLGLVATVGFIGWSTFGGYGSFMNHFGMGKDNILGAEIVNAQGELVEANEEVLKAIRGAGGALGVITSLRVKTYPLTKVNQTFQFLQVLSLQISGTCWIFTPRSDPLQTIHSGLPRERLQDPFRAANRNCDIQPAQR